MRDEKWYKDVEESIMIAHAKIDQLRELVAEIQEFIDALVELNSEEDVDGDEPDILR